MKFHSLRSLLAAVTSLGAALLLGSCGGGGAGSNVNQGGPLIFQPSGDNTTLYAGMPVTFQLSGGRAPYHFTSGDQGILPLPGRVDGHQVTVIPNNPGVIDAGLQPGELPRRTIQLFLRDSTGLNFNNPVQVAQNFLTGYGIVFSPTTCGAQACAGGETAIRMNATFNGSLAGGRTFRFTVIRGNFSFRDPPTGQVAQSVTTISDHSGAVTTVLVVPGGVPTQLAVLRVTDVATGVYVDHVFTISGTPPAATLVAIPSEFTFTGALSTMCGTGVADFYVFDGTPPYSAVSLHPAIRVEPPTSNSQPGRFTIRAEDPTQCVTDSPIIVTDSLGRRITVTVDKAPGTTDPPPPPPFSIGPTTLTLGCGQTGSVAIAGGSGNYFTASGHQNVTATVVGNTASITRNPTGTTPASVQVAISDGNSIANVTVNVPTTCP